MKNLRLAVAMLLAMSVLFSFTACKTMENGVEIKFATISLSFVDEDGVDRNEDVVIKLYTNYAPETIDRFIELATDGFYKNTVVNNAQTSWISLGGHKMNGELMEKLSSGKTINGEFYDNGWRGNTLTVTKGSVVMYRDFSTKSYSNYNTADCRFAICTSASAPFTSTEFTVIGKIEDSADMEVISDIIALAEKEGNDEDEILYNYYYAGGIAELAQTFIGENGQLTEEALENEIELTDIEEVSEGGDLYFEEGFITVDEYEDFKAAANKFINAVGDKTATYFYNAPFNTVTVTGMKISNKI